MKRVLFISVHPDDETYGCGGAILKHKQAGDNIYWLNFTGISIDHPLGFSKDFVDKRNELVTKISEAYGFEMLINLDLPTMILDTYPMFELVGKVDLAISEIKPEIIYIPNRSDVHSDHRVAFQAVYSCTKNFRKPFIKQILMYETLSETEFAPALAENAFVPNVFVNITDFFDRKLELIRMYDTELMPDPLPRSIHAERGLSSYRGSRIGVQYAEAFALLFMRE